MKVLKEIFVPKEIINDETVIIAKLYVKSGDYVNKGDILADIETSKTVISLEAECSGYVEVLCKEGEEVNVGELILRIYDTNDFLKDIKPKYKNNIHKEQNLETQFSKKALQLIEKYKIDKNIFKDMSFVGEKDVLKVIRKEKKEDNSYEIVKISRNKKIEIERLKDVQPGSLTSSLSVIIDGEFIFESISNNLKIFKDSLLPIAIYEVSKLLKLEKYKILNSFFEDDKIYIYKKINIGVAVDIDDGLKVLTLYDSDKLSISNIEEKLFNLIEKYRERKLDVKDISNSTFTITDLSSVGINHFIPLINSKQSAILAISKMDEKLKGIFLTIVFDHRVTEGKLAGMFLYDLKERIESYKFFIKDKNNLNLKCDFCLKTLEEDKKMGGPGLIEIINHNGERKFICSVCLRGF